MCQLIACTFLIPKFSAGRVARGRIPYRSRDSPAEEKDIEEEEQEEMGLEA